MIEVQNLCKYYGDFLALDNLNFKIETGRILGFLGPNGAGKTTTMKILSCFMAPSSGMVTINGMNVVTDSMRVKKITGYLPENPPLYYDMKVDEYLTYVAELKGVQADKIPARLEMVKEQCGLMERSKKLISTLSKGFKQRVGIAQSLINDPEVLILDEPTIGLDPKQISDIRTLIKSQAQQRTIILSTHILSEVTLICDDILIINKGRIFFNDSLANVGEKTDIEQLFMKYTYNYENADRVE
ncbi:MAG: ATP-binding cassette domain-containing protein [Endomicrobiales bacterium]